MPRRPVHGALLDAPDGAELVAVPVAARLEPDRHRVVEDLLVHELLHQRERRALVGAGPLLHGIGVIFLGIGLPPPAVEHAHVPEPRHAVLLAGAADERIVDLRVRQGLRRLGADERVAALAHEVVAEVERHERRHLVAEQIAHPLEVALEVHVLLEAVRAVRFHLAGVSAHVAAVLLAVVHAEPVVAQHLLEHFGDPLGALELRPRAGTRPRHEPPQVEQVEPAPLQLLRLLAHVLVEDHPGMGPDDVAQPVAHDVAVEGVLVARRAHGPQGHELETVVERLRVGRLHEAARVVRVETRVHRMRIGLHRIGEERARRRKRHSGNYFSGCFSCRHGFTFRGCYRSRHDILEYADKPDGAKVVVAGRGSSRHGQ